MRWSSRIVFAKWGLFLIAALLCVSALTAPSLAQDPPPNAQPPTPIGGVPDAPIGGNSDPPLDLPVQTVSYPITTDLAGLCQNIATQPPDSTGARPSLVNGTKLTSYNLMNQRLAMQAQIVLPPGALLTATGPAAWVGVSEGAVAIVSCQGDLVFDLTVDDNTQFVLSAGVGLVVDSSVINGVLLSLDEMIDSAWIVQLGDGAASTIAIEAEVGFESNVLCDRIGCWNTSQIDNSLDPNPLTPTVVTGGGGCAMVRCWSK